jgi:hypothetical protein
LKGEVNGLLQEKLNRDIIVTNMPTNFEIDSVGLVNLIVDYCGIDKKEVVLHFGYKRSKADGQGTSHNIIIKFSSAEVQQKFLLAKTTKRPLLYHQIFNSNNISSTRNLPYSESLTGYNLELLQEARRYQI